MSRVTSAGMRTSPNLTPDMELESTYRRVRVPPRVVALFTRQLSAMLLGGVPLLQALDTLQHNEDCPDLGKVVTVVADLIAAGHTFSNACSHFPRVFPSIYVSMASMGEHVGQLDQSLDRLALWLEKDEALRQRIISALTYPALILSVAGTLTLLLFYTVLPGFLQIFREMNIPLPLVTRVVMAITDIIRSPGGWLLGFSLFGLTFGGVQYVLNRRRLRIIAYRWVLRLPGLGSMLKAGALARFSAAAANLIHSGLELTKCYKLAAASSGSPLLEKDAANLTKAIQEGELASAHMEGDRDLYPPTLVHLVAAGEEVSQLPELLGRAAAYYEEECNYLVECLSAAIEPLLLGGVASIIATVVLSIFVPMYSFIGNLG
ncbi:MAG: type II secretion system F family protein [Candidatus Eremiobacteraeota bacterium]|nr:type II secretion system F family protein [Candidatus Eremiobacteraeota bacterium]